MATITIKVQGLEGLNSKMAKLGEELTDFSHSMHNIGEFLVEYYSTKPFVSRGGVYGAVWPALSPGYAEWKARHYPGRRIEILTGEMQASFAFDSGRDFVNVRNFSDHFEKQQQGIGVPQRLIMAVNSAIKREVTEEIKGDVQSTVERFA